MNPLLLFLGYVLDFVGAKGLSDRIFVKHAESHDNDYVVHRALSTLLLQDELEKARALAQKSWEISHSPRIGRDLVHIMLRKKEYNAAYSVAEEMVKRQTDNPWLRVLLGDISYFFLDDEKRALDIYLQAEPVCDRALPDTNPLAVDLKRLAKIYFNRQDKDNLYRVLEKFYSLGSTNFHDEDFVLLAKERFSRGDREGARLVLEEGIAACPRSMEIRECLEALGFERSLPPPKSKPRTISWELEGTIRIPIQTRLLVEGEDVVQTVAQYVRGHMEPGDIVTFSSCVAGLMEGRMLMEGTVRCSFMARTFSRFVSGKNVPRFGATIPMGNPLSFQALLEEVGTPRVLLAVAAGGLGRLFRAKGWFYMVAGPQSALIDDIMGSIPPYDYYVILGPKDPFKLSEDIAKATGAKGAAIVDANDLGIAWAVGYSKEVNPRALEEAMRDNPAGNQEQRTPIVIVRNLDQAKTPASTKAYAEDSGGNQGKTEKDKAT